MAEEPRARVVGMPRIENGEIVFDVRFEGSDDRTELVRATTKSPGVVVVPFFGHAEEAISAARREVVRWTSERQHLMVSLYARLATERRGETIRSQVRSRPLIPGGQGDDQPGAMCTLCDGMGEVERFAAGADGQSSWAFLPKTGSATAEQTASVVPCPACRRGEYEEYVGRTVLSSGLAAELERLGAVVSGRTATIRERLKAPTPSRSERAPRPRGGRKK
jgi:hypothetical protein